ncbi:MAG: T9SS type A sorting domain-containing protein [Flavobacteriaceae bacterium]|nr:T9SS type A sorting domain-containing protein [Flavobacteriaceae bacterium]
MKTILYILIFNFSALSFAQDPQLFENTWYLHNVIIDNQDNFPPHNSEVNNIPLDISINELFTEVCAPLIGSVIEFSTTEDKFTILEFMQFGTDCLNQENQLYQSLYFNNFFQPQLGTRIFIYQIEIGTNGSKSLTLINEEGNQAIYGDAPLSVFGFENNRLSIYPNPVKNELFLNSKNSNTNLKIKILNIEGKLISVKNVGFEKQVSIDVSNLTSGIYLLYIKDENGNKEVKKFLKE